MGLECIKNIPEMAAVCEMQSIHLPSPPLYRIILPQLEQCRKSPIKLGAIFLNDEEEFLNYSHYFKNMPHQTKLMEEGGIEFFAVSISHSH